MTAWDDDWTAPSLGDILYRGDIGMAGVRKRVVKKSDKDSDTIRPKSESPAKELHDLSKEVGSFKKQLEKQSEFLKDILPEISYLGDALSDAAVRMEQDTIDDVYSIGHMRDGFRKLSVKIKKHLPEEKIESPF